MGRVLEVERLSVEVDGKQVLSNVDLTLEEGETKAIFGPNGSGKTSLLMTIMGIPKYRVTGGRIIFKGQDITSTPMEKRARLGIGMSFQRPPVVRGVRLRDIILAASGRGQADASMLEMVSRAGMSVFLDRDVNLGFSGGEIKRAELLQLLAQAPELALLDEPESGVDLVSIAFIGEMIEQVLHHRPQSPHSHAGLIITHTGHILDYVHVDRGYVLLNGRIWCESNPKQILAAVRTGGYERCARCVN